MMPFAQAFDWVQSLCKKFMSHRRSDPEGISENSAPQREAAAH
jgi:hypothetical protein